MGKDASDGNVTGVGGTSAPASDLKGPVNSATSPDTPPDKGAAKCPNAKKHFVKVRLRFKDDDSDVPAEACKVLKGSAEVDGGPLTDGLLDVRNLDPGSYQTTFPEIDASEWAEG